jgi:hypothetical protein
MPGVCPRTVSKDREVIDNEHGRSAKYTPLVVFCKKSVCKGEVHRKQRKLQHVGTVTLTQVLWKTV